MWTALNQMIFTIVVTIIVLTSIAGCASFSERVTEIGVVGTFTQEIQNELGPPEFTLPISETEESWTYVQDSTTCTLKFEKKRLHERPECKERGQWALNEAKRDLERERAIALEKRQKPSSPPTEEAKKKPTDTLTLPGQLIPGYNADALGRPR